MPRVGPLKIKVQLLVGDETAFGPGRADLLAAIDRDGSISAAGRSLGMSYRYTWGLVESMNRCFAEKLVESVRGGSQGGGASLTDAGRRALIVFRGLEAEIMAGAQGERLSELSRMLFESSPALPVMTAAHSAEEAGSVETPGPVSPG